MFEILSNKTYRLIFILAVIVTLILTLSVPTTLARSGVINDKVAHAATFFVLAFLYSHSVGKCYGLKEVVLLLAFGFLIEVIQYILPWRSFSLLDWLADFIGIAIYEIIHRLKNFYLDRHGKHLR